MNILNIFLNAVAFADDPMAAEKASEGGFIEGEIDGAAVGTGAGVVGALPLIDEGLHFGQAEGRAVADCAAAGGRYLGGFEISSEAQFHHGIHAIFAIRQLCRTVTHRPEVFPEDIDGDADALELLDLAIAPSRHNQRRIEFHQLPRGL